MDHTQPVPAVPVQAQQPQPQAQPANLFYFSNLKPAVTAPCILPSRGLRYGGKLADGKVEVHKLRGQQEEFMSAANDANFIYLLRHMAKQVTIFPREAMMAGFKFEDLLVTDFMALLFSIFAHTYGPELPLSPECPYPNCKKPSPHNLPFSQLKCIFAEEIPGFADKEYTCTLPNSLDVVNFRQITLADMERIELYADQLKNKSMGEGDPAHFYSLAQHIISINGHIVEGPKDGKYIPTVLVISWLRSLEWGDINFLKDAFDSKCAGYDMQPEFMCKHCRRSYRVQLPMDGSFFRSYGANSRIPKRAEGGAAV